MSQNKGSQPSGDSKSKRANSSKTKKSINPDKLLSDINQQTEALNKIIQRFSEPKKEKDLPDNPKKKNKSTNK